MVWKSRLVVLLVAAVALAGCGSKSGSGDGGEGSPFVEETAEGSVVVTATSSTGIIRGLVLDDAVRPIAGATLTIRTQDKTLTTNSTAVGAFGFAGLKEGTYFVKAHKAGYLDIQSSVDVKAGDNEPKIVKIGMQLDSSFVKPYFQAQKIEGYVECTTSAVAACGAVNIVAGLPCEFDLPCAENATNDRFGMDIFYAPNATAIQSELQWESTQTASVELSMEMENIRGCTVPSDTYVHSVQGPSPIFNKIGKKDIEKVGFGGECAVFHSIFSGDTQGAPAGATAQQPYTIITHSFYGFEPKDGWRFTVDGDPKVPA